MAPHGHLFTTTTEVEERNGRREQHVCIQQTQYKGIASFLQGKQVCSHFLKGGRPSFD